MLVEQGVELNARRIYANLQEAVESLQSRRTAAHTYSDEQKA
jgi:hypothetical protein